jgi:hypothetical protein
LALAASAPRRLVAGLAGDRALARKQPAEQALALTLLRQTAGDALHTPRRAE